jgi:YidC/Oxa1 family membrane protein insertase
MLEHKNTIIAIVLSLAVMVGWQILVGYPQMKKEQEQARLKQQEQSQTMPGQTQPGQAQNGQAQPSGQTPQSTAGGLPPQAPGVPNTAAASQAASRETVIASTPRVAINTPRLGGSIDLKGGRIDDLTLTQYRETIDPNSPPIVLFSPSGAPDAYYAEFGWVAASGTAPTAVPGADTVWKQQGSGALSIDHPVTLTYDNGQGLVFTRTISIDDHYMFGIKDSVANKGSAAVTLFPYGLISRHGTPPTLGYYILHEGLIGVMGDHGEQTETYKKMQEAKSQSWDATNVWLGFTDKYFAATLVPQIDAKVRARFSGDNVNGLETYQTDYLAQPVTIAPGATGADDTRLFAGAKEISVVGIDFPLGPGGYNAALNLNHFDLLIDWGWFYFITKPMFLAIDYFYHVVGNFGIAILIVTVLVKLLFFPLANKSYASMAKMKAVQPQMAMIKERYADDKVKQQQAMMELYKKEQINPIAGCLPIAIQIPVFFSLYKVLFITIEMRHAPFYGWIHDLSAQDPTNIFTLGGLIPFDPTVIPMIGSFLHLGFWPAIMGVTMWVQMKLNPAPPDPTQQVIFNWMPLIFTFMLAKFPAGLVIYWAWNNSLSVAQQSVIMHRNGAKIQLWDNLKSTFVRTKPKAPPAE